MKRYNLIRQILIGSVFFIAILVLPVVAQMGRRMRRAPW